MNSGGGGGACGGVAAQGGGAGACVEECAAQRGGTAVRLRCMAGMPWRAVGRLWEEAGGGPEKAPGKTRQMHVVVVTSSSNSLQSGKADVLREKRTLRWGGKYRKYTRVPLSKLLFANQSTLRST